ncbi:MAG: hypothetical protein J6W96_05760 [Alphaproteobacteria bacterium]|nr:hypothetical protein [Alphaproteobacteria bacterium]
MEKKKIYMALGGGFIVGVATALVVCSLCNCPGSYSRNPQMQPKPDEMVMREHRRPHGMHQRPDFKGHHGKHFGKMHGDMKGKPFEPSPEMKARFAEKLGLTDEQKEQLEKYRTEDMAKMKPLVDQMDALRAQMKELRQENRARFESVLTDEQKEILKNMKKEHRHPHFMGAPMAEGFEKAPVPDDAPVGEDAPVAEDTVSE